MAGTWERLAHVELSVAGSLDTGTFTAKKKLKIQIWVKNNGAAQLGVRFNNDSGNNYPYRVSINGGTDASAGGINRIVPVSSTTSGYTQAAVLYVTNLAAEEKLVIAEGFGNSGAGATSAPNRREGVAKWVNTSAQITSVQVLEDSGSGGNFAAGSYITVWGASDDVVTDEKTTLTDIEGGTQYRETDTRKIYRRKAAPTIDFEDDFSGTDNWTDSGTHIAVNTTTDVIDWDGITTNSMQYATINQVASNDSFVLRWDITIDNLTTPSGSSYFAMVLSDSTTQANSTQDALGFLLANRSGGQKEFYTLDADGQSLVFGGGAETLISGVTPTSGNTYYFEVKRLSSTQAEFNIYSDSDYSDSLHSSTITIASTITNLDQILFTKQNAGAATGSMDGTINKVQFWDGVTSTDASWIERGTAE